MFDSGESGGIERVEDVCGVESEGIDGVSPRLRESRMFGEVGGIDKVDDFRLGGVKSGGIERVDDVRLRRVESGESVMFLPGEVESG